MATQPDSRRYSTNIKRMYDALRVGIPANQIIVLYGDSAAITTTPDGTPINGPMTRNAFSELPVGATPRENYSAASADSGNRGFPIR
jgi:hypothetical protein